MSLKVWLPLNGTLENKGTTDITVSNYGATVDNNGKIGKCYNFSDNSYISTSDKTYFLDTNKRSIALWIYPTSNNCAIMGTTPWQWQLCVKSNVLWFNQWNNSGVDNLFVTTSVSSIPLNAWTHICLSWDGSIMRVYINGIYNCQTSFKFEPSCKTNYLTNIGGNIYSNNTGGVGYFIGSINDVRIYDHALSSVEVKEISRALTRHYKLDSTDIIDSSGYNNHGTVYGTATLNADTPRYSNCIYMNNRSSTNHIEANSINASDNKFSVSFWVKAAKSTAQVLFADQKMTVGLLSGGITACPTSSRLFSNTNFKDNNWNHIVAIRDGSSYSLYINGTSVSLASSSNYYVHNADKLWLLNRSYNTSYAGNGYMSDFRVYNTILSADDVLQLYNIGAKIDNMKNLHCYEIQEYDTTDTTKLLKTGVFKAVEFNEVDNSMEIKEDGDIDCNKIIEI